jgi:hypothetical protein
MDSKTKIEMAELALKIVVAIAGGLWAFALLFMLKQRALADANLRKIETEIREIELNVRQQAVVTTSIGSTIVSDPDGKGYLVIAVVDIANLGNRNTRIKWKDELPAFYVRRMKFNECGEPIPDNESREFRVPLTMNPYGEARSHVIRAGATEVISFVFRVSATGCYLLSFRGAVAPEEREEAEKLGATLLTAWTANKYIMVGKDPIPSSPHFPTT